MEESVRITEDRDKWRKYVHGVANPRLLKNRTEQWERLTNKNFIETTRKFFTFDVSTSIRGLHRKKLVLGLLLPVVGAIS